jgi:hypothetical protein
MEYYITIRKKLNYGYIIYILYPKFLEGGQESPLGSMWGKESPLGTMCQKQNMHI